MPSLSLIIPVHNEAGNLEPLAAELRGPLDRMAPDGDWEVWWVDDGSTDGTPEVLQRLHRRDGRFKVIRFRRSLGQTAALKSGFDHARGRILFSMDGDLQNDPADLPALKAKLEEGFDVVCGWRKERREPWLRRRLPSAAANALIRALTGLDIHDSGCTLRAYTAKAAKTMELYGEMHRLIPMLAFAGGALVAEIPVRHRARSWGQSKYTGLGWGWRRPLNVFLDILTIKFLLTWFTRPIHIFGGVGLGGFFLSVLSFGVVLYMKYATGFPMTGNPFLYFAVLLSVVAVQLLVLGLLAEVMVRTYFESQDKSIYAVDFIHDDDSPPPTG